MPLVKIEVSKTLSDQEKSAVISKTSAIVSSVTGKSQQYVMVTLHEVDIYFASDRKPSLCVDVKSIGGLSGAVCKKLSQEISELAEEIIGITPARIYITFSEYDAKYWGWNKTTFG